MLLDASYEWLAGAPDAWRLRYLCRVGLVSASRLGLAGFDRNRRAHLGRHELGDHLPLGVLAQQRTRAAVDELLVEDPRLLQEFLVALVAEDFERVEDFNVRVGAERQSQAAAQRLLG